MAAEDTRVVTAVVTRAAVVVVTKAVVVVDIVVEVRVLPPIQRP